MELFFPSLSLLLLAVAFVYFWMPAFAPPLLIAGSVIMLVAAVYVHISQFGRTEYEQSTWQYKLRQYSSWVIVGAILLGAYGFFAMNTASEPSTFQSPALPPIAAPMMGGGYGTIMKTATSRINELMRRGRISTD
jgi:hypothetical protein